MPQLLQMLEYVLVETPFPPIFWVKPISEQPQ